MFFKHKILPYLCSALLVFVCCSAPPAYSQSLTPPISDAEAALYERWLRLNDDQAVVMHEMHAHYLDIVRTKHRDDIRALNKELSTVMTERAQARPPYPADLNDRFTEIEKKFDDFDTILKQLEEAFFRQVESLLRTDQLEYVPRMRNGRRRIVASRIAKELPEGRVDLIALVDRLPLSAEQYARIEGEFMSTFEPRYIAALESSIQAMRQRVTSARNVLEIEGAILSATQNEQIELARETAEMRERLGRPRIAACERVLALVRDGRARLLDTLPQDVTDEFDELYRATAYPSVYPDPLEASSLFSEVLGISSLRGEQRLAVEQLQRSYEQQHTRLSREMALAVHDRYWSTYAGQPSRRGDSMARKSELLRLGQKREELNLNQINLIRQALPTEMHEDLPRWEFTALERPRPWDRDYEREREQEKLKRELQRQIQD